MRPLEGVRVLAIEQYAAGPFGTLHLADLGADIIKIEDPNHGGDFGRYVPPFQEGEDSLFFQTFNRNKRSISLDLQTPAGREVFEDLVRESDAVFSNLRGDVPRKLRIRYEDLSSVNQRIVCSTLTGFGVDSPRAREPGYDYIIQALAGWMTLTGSPSGPPEKTGPSVVDYSAGLVAALALQVGIHAARRSGVGMDCDVSLFDTAISLLTYLATWHLTTGYEPQRYDRSAHPSLVPFQLFTAQDGWIVVGCAKEKFWDRLTALLDHTGLARDERFDSFESRARHRVQLQEILDREFSRRPVSEWIERLGEAAIPCAPVNGVAEALEEDVVEERNLVISVPHARFGTVRSPASPVRVGERGRPTYLPAPSRGQHTESILREVLGYTEERILSLKESGAIGFRQET